MPKLPETAFFPLAPDWVCEILSPSTTRYDRGAKRDIYGDFGVKHIWHVDPDAKLLEAFEMIDGRWVLLKALKDNDTVALPPFEAAPFELGQLWA
jgi:Uma2 family endonuclease